MMQTIMNCPCPSCGVVSGERCITPENRFANLPHSLRVKAGVRAWKAMHPRQETKPLTPAEIEFLKSPACLTNIVFTGYE